MLDDYLDPEASRLSSNPFAEERKRYALMERMKALGKPPEPPEPGWEGVRPEVDARKPPPPRLPPPTLHYPDPAVSASRIPTVEPVAPGGGAVAGTPPPPAPPPGAPQGSPLPAPVASKQALPPPPPPPRMGMRPQAHEPTDEDQLREAQDADAAESRRRAVRDDLLYAFGGPMRGAAPSHENVLALQGQQLMRQQGEAKRYAAAMADPTSPESQRARAMFKALRPDLAEKFGAEWDGIPGAALPGGHDLLMSEPKPKQALLPEESRHLNAQSDLAEAEAYAKMHPQAKPPNPNEIDPEAARKTIAATYAEELPKRPALQKQLANAHTKEEFDTIEKSLEADRGEKHGVGKIYVQGAVADTNDMKKGAREQAVPGLEAPGASVRLDPGTVKNVRDAKTKAELVGNFANQAADLLEDPNVKSTDLINPRTPAGSRAQQLSGALQLHYNELELGSHRLPNGPEADVLHGVLKDPTSLWTLAPGQRQMLGRAMRMIAKDAQMTADVTAKSAGYKVPSEKTTTYVTSDGNFAIPDGDTEAIAELKRRHPDYKAVIQ